MDWTLLQFCDNMNQPDRTIGTDRLSTVASLFNKPNNTATTLYSWAEHLVVNEVILPFEEKIISRQYISKKHKCFCTTIYKLSGITGYTYNMST